MISDFYSMLNANIEYSFILNKSQWIIILGIYHFIWKNKNPQINKTELNKKQVTAFSGLSVLSHKDGLPPE